MNKQTKELIATKKITDDQIFDILSKYYESEHQTDSEESDTAEDETAEEESPVETDATIEQPDIRAIIQEEVGKVLAEMKKGKPVPKPKKIEPSKKIEFEYGAI